MRDSIDPRSARVQAFLQLLKQRHVTLDPTLARSRASSPIARARSARASRRWPIACLRSCRRGLLEGGLPVPGRRRTRAIARRCRRCSECCWPCAQAGVPFVAGTDAMAGFTLPRELELYVEAGVPGARGAADRHARCCAARRSRRRARVDRARQAGRHDPRRRRPEPDHRRRAAPAPRDQGRHIFDPDALCRALGIQPVRRGK